MNFKIVPDTPVGKVKQKRTSARGNRYEPITRVNETPMDNSKRQRDNLIWLQGSPPDCIKFDEEISTQSSIVFQEEVKRSSILSQTLRKNGFSRGGKSNMVCSLGTFDDYTVIKQIIHNFGFEWSDLVTSRTTHVICCSDGTTQRTLELLRGVLHGCWIVSKDWILTSLEKGYLVEETPYERIDFSDAVKLRRIERFDFGSCGTELLSHLGSIHVSRKSSFSSKDVGYIIRLAGGRISLNIKTAEIIIGKYEDGLKAICLKESWLLDSIQQYAVMPYNSYILNS